MPRSALRTIFPLFAVIAFAQAQDLKNRLFPQQILGPEKPAEFAAWLGNLQAWRTERYVRMGYSPAAYEEPRLAWSQRNFFQPQMMIEERYFYDPVAGHYTVDRYLDDLEARYGGVDSVLLWTFQYPNIGVDDRNQFDRLRGLPGGIPALRRMVDDFHRRGVKVFIPTNPWDRGTRDEGRPEWVALAELMKAIDADGVNGDTFTGMPRAYWDAAVATGHPVVFEPENGTEADEQLAWNLQSWGYWNQRPPIPPVSRYKWLEPRHIINVCRRWERDRTDSLQLAFFNGVGYETWENIWGIWNQLTPRAAETVRRIRRIYRQWPELLVSPAWEPHTPTLQRDVYATKFPGDAGTLWTIVNRSERDAAGGQLRVPAAPGMRYFDVWHGVELTPETIDGMAVLRFELEAQGFGAVFASAKPDAIARANEFAAANRSSGAQRLNALSNDWNFLPQRMVEIAPTKPAATPPPGMVRIPRGEFAFNVSGIEIEGKDEVGVGVQYPWEDTPHRHHRHPMTVASFYIDRYPVTNAEFKRFMDATRYHPRDDMNFLRDWRNGTYPAGWDRKPVTWVSLEDARAYAQWAGKRLPHGWEWQYAAQGTDGRLYPWGAAPKADAVPPRDHGRLLPPPSEVDAHPGGASPFGVMDLVGNVWQWTDEFVDEHTRTAILRGGSHYRPDGSSWYFPNTQQLDQHGKYLLMSPGVDRSGAIGFRCVVDAE